jgi:hypothetical protein
MQGREPVAQTAGPLGHRRGRRQSVGAERVLDEPAQLGMRASATRAYCACCSSLWRCRT